MLTWVGKKDKSWIVSETTVQYKISQEIDIMLQLR